MATQMTLVTGATGAQGGATARELLAHGHVVRILTRAPDGAAAQILARSGAEPVRGDLGDSDSLDAAMRGVTGVFSVQVPDMAGTDDERRHGLALVRAALKAGVSQFVHTSVTGTADHRRFPRWGTRYWNEKYWTDKWDVEEAVRSAGFASWTVLRPAFMMENFAQPKSLFLFPHLRHGEIATALHTGTRMQLIAACDIGAFARTAFDEPRRFNRLNIDLAAQAATMGELAAILTRVCGKTVIARELTPDQARARGLYPLWVNSQEWSNEVGYRADIEALQPYGIPLTSFEQWARGARADIVIE
jgi:uncharacterized protein YbjT (DUF2867 family)